LGSKLVERVFFRNQRLVGLAISRPTLFLKRHIRLVSASVAFAIGLMMVSAFSVALIPAPKHMAFVENYPLWASIELEKQEFNAGENVTATCKLKNIGNEAITIHFSQEMRELDESGGVPHSYRVYFNLVVTDTEGNTVFSWQINRGATGNIVSISVGPGEELSNTFMWNQKTKDVGGLGEQVPPGTYLVKAKVAPRALLWINDGPWITLETPSILLVVK